jgi:hypothetical protein
LIIRTLNPKKKKGRREDKKEEKKSGTAGSLAEASR